MERLIPDTKDVGRQDGGGFSLRSIVMVLYRRRFVVMAIALPLIIVGGINLFGQAGTFTASTRIVVDLARVDLPKWNVRSGSGVNTDRELNTLVNSAMTMPVALAAAKALGDSIQVMMQLDPKLVGLDEPGVLGEYLLGGFDADVAGESSILNFQFTSASPRISLMAVGAMRDAFLNFHVFGQKNSKAVEYYEEQVAGLHARMDSLLATRGNVLRAAGYSSITDEMENDSGRLANIEVELLSVEVARRSLESEYAKLLTYLDGDPRDFPMGPDENRSTTLVFWMNTVAEHDNALSGILSLYNDDSGPVTRQRTVIDESLKKLVNEEHKYVRSVGLALISLREKEATLSAQQVKVHEENSRAPEVYRQVSMIDLQLSSINVPLKSLQEKISEVRMAQYADERVSNTSLLSNPVIVSVFSGGTTIVYFIALILISLALGIISGFVVENLDHRVYSPLDVEENLKLPVFASVSRVE